MNLISSRDMSITCTTTIRSRATRRQVAKLQRRRALRIRYSIPGEKFAGNENRNLGALESEVGLELLKAGN
jgi:hypothetical protein